VVIDKRDFIKKLESLLVYHKSIGIHYYPRSGDLDSFCKLSMVDKSLSEGEEGGKETVAGVGFLDRREKKESIDREGTLADIQTEIAICKACDLHENRIYPVAGSGKNGARLLIIGDWLSGNVDGQLVENLIMGVEQDQMLTKMLAAMKILPEEVFVTNVIKCAVPASCHPLAAHVRCCMSFLRRQIALVAPEVICTMGMVAAKAVLDRPQSLSQLRGKFHIYGVEGGMRIPVLTTYHPTYLVQNPEMKKATWADLQLLSRRLEL